MKNPIVSIMMEFLSDVVDMDAHITLFGIGLAALAVDSIIIEE